MVKNINEYISMSFGRNDIILTVIYYICLLKVAQMEVYHPKVSSNDTYKQNEDFLKTRNQLLTLQNNNSDRPYDVNIETKMHIQDIPMGINNDDEQYNDSALTTEYELSDTEQSYQYSIHSETKYDSKILSKRNIENNSMFNESYDRDLLLAHISNSSSNCSNDYCISDEDYMNMIDEYMFPTSYEWLLILLHSMVFLIGLIGNALVCVAVYRNHSMRTVTNYFIVNLAVADFMVILFCLPPTVLWDVTETWFMGKAMCKIVLYIQTVSVTVSVLTLTFISIDRWYAICFPLKFKSTTSRAKKAILIIWLLALAFDIPELVVLTTIKRLERVDTPYFTQCEASWSSDSDTTWSVLKMILLYALPLVFMSVAYFQIVCVLWKSDYVSGRMMMGSSSTGLSGHHRQADMFTMNSNASTEGQLRSRRKAAKMLVAVVVMFAVCYFPVHLFSVMRITMKLPQNDLNTALALLSHWMCYANSAVNPVIYNFMSGKFRKEFHNTFGCSYCCKQKSLSRHQRNMTRSSTYVYRFTHGGSTMARTEVMPLSQLHHNHQEHFHPELNTLNANNNQCYILHELDQYMHSTC